MDEEPQLQAFGKWRSDLELEHRDRRSTINVECLLSNLNSSAFPIARFPVFYPVLAYSLLSSEGPSYCIRVQAIRLTAKLLPYAFLVISLFFVEQPLSLSV